MFDGGLRSDFYCLPVAKREKHRLALRAAAVSGSSKFFLGTDSAPHTRLSKETSCGCAGIFNSPNAIESYAEVFSEEGAIDRLEAFASEFGPTFYGLPLNNTQITLAREETVVPDFCEMSTESTNQPHRIVPFHAGESLSWSVISSC